MPFKPAVKEVGFVKGSMFGPKGTGKTTLQAMLLIYLAKKYHGGAPVAWLASEKGVDFVTDIFKAEGVPLLLNRSRSFLDLRDAAKEAIQSGACAVGVDSVSHFWGDLFDAGMKANGPRLQKIMRIKQEWAPFAASFQDSPIHFLVTGRMGYNWDEFETEDENGRTVKEISKAGTKIKAEGDFGHEPDLEIECAQMDDPDLVKFEVVKGKKRKSFKSQMIHIATVKKCRVWALNGQAFSWKDQKEYKPGYYLTVGDCFKPYFDSINIGGANATAYSEKPSTSVLFTNGDARSLQEQETQRTILLEKWQGTMELVAGGQTKDNIRKRAILGEQITGTRSKTQFERQPLETIQRCVNVLVAVEERLKVDVAENDEDLREICNDAAEAVDHPGRGLTLVGAMTAGKPNGHAVAEPF